MISARPTVGEVPEVENEMVVVGRVAIFCGCHYARNPLELAKGNTNGHEP